jgi:acetylornithine/succinyldiaminopimelate/putrescine aminotransferase
MSASVDPDVAISNEDYRYRRCVNPRLADLLRSLRLDKAFVWGEGTRLRDAFGREYLDFIAGYGSVPFGHNHKAIWDAVLCCRQDSEPSRVEAGLFHQQRGRGD